MECKELIKKLRNCGGGTEGIKLVNEAANKLEWLQKLNHKLEEDFMELVMESENICKFCKHNFECKGKECDKYMEGKGCWDANKCYHKWDWSCQDFDFGTCDMLENTPCNGCLDNNNEGFEWRGNV